MRPARSLLSRFTIVSAVSAWEIAIKRGLGKLDAPIDFAEEIVKSGLVPLAVTIAHAVATEKLPMHHRDPFDRMLIAQAVVENAILISRDSQFSLYGVSLITA
jgi:PIN domain nuclease of toxin-antitoxin system